MINMVFVLFYEVWQGCKASIGNRNGHQRFFKAIPSDSFLTFLNLLYMDWFLFQV